MGSPKQSAVESYSTVATNLVTTAIVRVCCNRFGNALRAIVLTGSLARGEGTWVRRGKDWLLLGDADLFLVFQSGVPLPAKGTRTEEEAIERALVGEDVIAHVRLAPVDPEFLARMPPHIATFELRTCGRVLWGDAEVLSLVPEFSVAELSREDAWRMLANRIIEQLEAAATCETVHSARSQYATVKLILDIATSYLVFAGLYQPHYGERSRVLQQTARHQNVEAPFPLAPFAEILNAATAYKLQATPMPYSPERLWAATAGYAEDLWTWQLVRLTGGSSSSGAKELMKLWMRQMPWDKRLRGWASAARRSRLNVTRWLWLMLKSSPRYLTYATATEVFFRVPWILVQGQDLTNWTELASNLPLRGGPGVRPDDWQAMAKIVAFNYRQLLESTTA